MEEKNFLEIYKDVITKNYTNFKGRARRREYWGFALVNFGFGILAILLDRLLGLQFSDDIMYGYIYLAYILLTFLPGLGLAVRRLHDIGKSGAMLFIALIPIIGGIWLLVLLVKEGDRTVNEYGPNPKEINQADEISEIGQQ